MARSNIRMNSLNEPYDSEDNRSSPTIRIDTVESQKLRSNSLGGGGRESPGLTKDRNSSNKLLKGAILHNLLHPLHYYHERKVRSRSNSCSDDIDREDISKMPNIQQSRSRPASPTIHLKEDYWPVYKPGSFRGKRPISEQLSCPPAPESISFISPSQFPSNPHLNVKLSSPPHNYTVSPCPTATEFFSHSIKNPIERHKDGHMLEHRSTRRKHNDSISSISTSDSSCSENYSDFSWTEYSSHSSTDEDSEEEPSKTSDAKSNILSKSPSVERRSSEPLSGAIETTERTNQLTKSPLYERRSSGQQHVSDRPSYKSTLSVPIPKQTHLSSGGTSPSSKLISLIVSGIDTVKKSSSHIALHRKKKKKKKKKKSVDSWENDIHGKDHHHGIDFTHIFSKSPPKEEIPEVSSVEKLYAIYDQIILEGQLHRRHSMEPERRRNLSGGSQSGTYLRGEDPNQAAILFRDSRGLPVAAQFLDIVSRSELEQDETQILVKFFKHHRTYDLIPMSAKLVIFDTRLQVKKAFYALVHNGVRAAPLWDSRRQQFVGMLTITDFIRILQNFYHTNRKIEELEEHTLELWRSLLHDDARALVSIGPDESLFVAIKMLINHKIHRLPVIDMKTGNVLYIITHKRILKFLYLYMNELPKPSILQKTLSEVSIGTYENIQTATEDTRLIEALDTFVKHRVSALPIIDNDGRLIDIYAKFDAINLAAKGTYNNLNVTLKEANEYRNEWFEGVLKCTYNETLEVIMDRIVKAEVHRLVVVDKADTVIGVLSLSDLLKELVLRPEKNSETLHSVSVEDVMTATKGKLSPQPSSDDSEEIQTVVTQTDATESMIDMSAEESLLQTTESSVSSREFTGA